MRWNATVPRFSWAAGEEDRQSWPGEGESCEPSAKVVQPSKKGQREGGAARGKGAPGQHWAIQAIGPPGPARKCLNAGCLMHPYHPMQSFLPDHGGTCRFCRSRHRCQAYMGHLGPGSGAEEVVRRTMGADGWLDDR